MRNGQVTYDVFLCYKSEDADAAESLRIALKSAGLRVFVDVIDGELWAPLNESITDALMRSRTLVALMTPHFPISPHCRDELHSALYAAYYLDDGDTSRVMAITHGTSADEVRPQQLTRFRLPFHGTPPADMVRRIVETVRRCHQPFGAAPPPQPPKWHPDELVGDPTFRGRSAELWELHEGLRAREKNRDRGHPVVAVRGSGGLGKTALCLQYARLFERDHPGGVFVLRLGGSGDDAAVNDKVIQVRYEQQLALLADNMRVRTTTDVKATLDADATPYLWIVDDVPATISPALLRRMSAPTRHGKTLLTTRGRLHRLVSLEIDLPPLGVEACRAVLTAYRTPERGDSAAVSEIVRLLGQHPLGLTLAAGLTTLPTFTDYRALLTELSAPAPDWLEVAAQMEGELPAGCAQPFTNAVLRSFGALGPAAQDVLHAASVLAPTVIPYQLLSGMARRATGTDEGTLVSGLDETVRRGLVDRADPLGCVVHPLVARAVRIRVPAAGRARLRDAAVVELTEAVERTRDAYRHREVIHHLPHVRAVAGLMAGGDSWRMGLDEHHLVNEAARTQVEAGDSRAALAGYQALHAALATAGTVDRLTALSVLLGRSVAHGLEGDFSVALRLKTEVYDELARFYGPKDPDTLMALNNLAISHMDLEAYAPAHAMLAHVYRMRRDHPDIGPQHRHTLVALANLAIARGHLGASRAEREHHYRVAHRYWLALKARWERIAKPDDQHALDVLNGLALNLRALGRLDEALKIASELYDLRTQLLGPDHADTLGALENKLIIKEEIGGRRRRDVSGASPAKAAEPGS